ncbi:MAG: anti-sigma factor antagonist [Chloroflexi bacterium]|jgi:anti-anti-sigma factor|nr:anti-sigma factor antagonist [Chloroflexota bacterium]
MANLEDLERPHPVPDGATPVYDNGRLRVTRTLHPPTLSLTGEIDQWNARSVTRGLQAALEGEGDVHLDLSGVAFCDVDGIRALVTTAEGLSEGRRVVIHGLPAQLKKVIRLVGWDNHPALVIPA